MVGQELDLDGTAVVTLEEYKNKMQEVAATYGKFDRGQKYVRKWDYYLKEKQFVLEKCNLEGIHTALDIGTGVGMIPFLLLQKGIKTAGTDLEDGMYKDCCDVLGFHRFQLEILPQQSMNISYYDLIIATRTEFDRQFTCESAWIYFLEDAMQSCKRLFLKLNCSGHTPGHVPVWIKEKYMFYPKLGKPYRAWYLQIDSAQWQQDNA